MISEWIRGCLSGDDLEVYVRLNLKICEPCQCGWIGLRVGEIDDPKCGKLS